MLKSQFAKAWDHKVFIWNNVIRISNWFFSLVPFISNVTKRLVLHTILRLPFDMKLKFFHSNDVTHRWCIFYVICLLMCENKASFIGIGVVVRKACSFCSSIRIRERRCMKLFVFFSIHWFGLESDETRIICVIFEQKVLVAIAGVYQMRHTRNSVEAEQCVINWRFFCSRTINGLR